jgi:hypothetical protein
MKDFYAFATANPELVFFSFWVAVWGITKAAEYLVAPFTSPRTIIKHEKKAPAPSKSRNNRNVDAS